MSKYDQHNRRVPKGNGKCNNCKGTGWRGPRSCLCSRPDAGRPSGTCARCRGSGIDKFGAYCTECSNNKEEYGTYEYSLKLFDEINNGVSFAD